MVVQVLSSPSRVSHSWGYVWHAYCPLYVMKTCRKIDLDSVLAITVWLYVCERIRWVQELERVFDEYAQPYVAAVHCTQLVGLI